MGKLPTAANPNEAKEFLQDPGLSNSGVSNLISASHGTISIALHIVVNAVRMVT